jgi:hypothetical protein
MDCRKCGKKFTYKPVLIRHEKRCNRHEKRCNNYAESSFTGTPEMKPYTMPSASDALKSSVEKFLTDSAKAEVVDSSKMSTMNQGVSADLDDSDDDDAFHGQFFPCRSSTERPQKTHFEAVRLLDAEKPLTETKQAMSSDAAMLDTAIANDKSPIAKAADTIADFKSMVSPSHDVQVPKGQTEDASKGQTEDAPNDAIKGASQEQMESVQTSTAPVESAPVSDGAESGPQSSDSPVPQSHIVAAKSAGVEENVGDGLGGGVGMHKSVEDQPQKAESSDAKLTTGKGGGVETTTVVATGDEADTEGTARGIEGESVAGNVQGPVTGMKEAAGTGVEKSSGVGLDGTDMDLKEATSVVCEETALTGMEESASTTGEAKPGGTGLEEAMDVDSEGTAGAGEAGASGITMGGNCRKCGKFYNHVPWLKRHEDMCMASDGQQQ